MLEDLLRLVLLWQLVVEKIGMKPSEEDFCYLIQGLDKETDKLMYNLISQLTELMSIKSQFIKTKKKMNI